MKKFLVRVFSETEGSAYEYETDSLIYREQGVIFPRSKSSYFVPYENIICIIERKDEHDKSINE